MNEMLKQFNLPNYIDGLSFADASKKIQSRFKERTDQESIATEKDMLGRLKQMQEHVKAQQEAQEEPERSGGDLVAGSEGMPLDEEEITQEYDQEQGAEEDLMSQIQNDYGGNQYAYGGPGEETPATKPNKGLLFLDKKYGKPNVVQSSILPKRASYLHPVNTMFLNKSRDEDPKSYISELSHAVQHSDNSKYKRTSNNVLNKLNLNQRQGYYEPGNTEFQAHKEIQPYIQREYDSVMGNPYKTKLDIQKEINASKLKYNNLNKYKQANIASLKDLENYSGERAEKRNTINTFNRRDDSIARMGITDELSVIGNSIIGAGKDMYSKIKQTIGYAEGGNLNTNGGDEENLHFMPETAEQRFSPVMQANNQSISSSIMSLTKTASSVGADGEDKEETNDFEMGGDPSEYYQNNNPYFTTNPGQINPNVREEGINPQMASQFSSMSGYNPQSNPSPSMGPATSGISDGAGKVAGGSGPGVAGYAQMGATAIELGQEALGPTGVDTSGRSKVVRKKAGNAALAGAAKGASAGMVLGPWGAAAGAVIGGVAGIIGAKKQRKAADIANRNAAYADSAVNDNQFANGGEENPFGKAPKSVAETLMATSKGTKKIVAPAMNYDTLESQYKDFRMAKLDSIAKNNQVMPSGKYVKLSGGRNKLAEVDTALIDAVESAEKRAGLKRGDLGATVNRESNYGGQYGAEMNYGKEMKKMGQTIDLLSMSNNYKGTDKYTGSEPLRHFADLKAPGVTTTKDFHGQYYQVTDKKLLDAYIKKNPQAVAAYNKKLHSGPTVGNKNSLDFLADDMKATGNTQKYRKQYNPGDKNYANLMEQDARDLQSEKAYNKYLDTNKFDMGGELNQFHKGGKPGHTHKPEAKVVKRPDLESVSSLTPAGLVDKKTIFTGKKDDDRDLLTNYTKENKLGMIKFPDIGKKKADHVTALQRIKLGAINASEFVGENKDALRYAPAFGNMLQLAKLKKPEQETTPELNTRYKKSIFDEKGLTNLVQEEAAATREAILGASEGSGNAARANLLGTQLNSTKALSDAFMKSSEANARENTQEQTFNLGVDTTNLQQQTLAQDIRARNKGAYDTEKSRLMTAVAADLGSVGQEELYKKFPELMGASYDWKGKYKKLKDEVDKGKAA